ncbi:unnamed protein product, partial [marine sediment metagenome]
ESDNDVTVMKDEVDPEITERDPDADEPKSPTSTGDFTLKATLSDIASGINPSTINLTVCNASDDSSTLCILGVITSTELTYNQGELTYSFYSGLTLGDDAADYTAQLTVKDWAGNELIQPWTFSIDPNIPAIQEWTFKNPGGSNLNPLIHDGVYYVNIIDPKITVEFQESTTQITKYEIYNYTPEGTLEETAFQTKVYDLGSEPIELTDIPAVDHTFSYDGATKYRLKVYAQRDLGGVYGRENDYDVDFVIDISPLYVELDPFTQDPPVTAQGRQIVGLDDFPHYFTGNASLESVVELFIGGRSCGSEEIDAVLETVSLSIASAT